MNQKSSSRYCCVCLKQAYMKLALETCEEDWIRQILYTVQHAACDGALLKVSHQTTAVARNYFTVQADLTSFEFNK